MHGRSAPTVAGHLAIVVGADRRAHAYELESGRERWSRAMVGAGAPEAPPAVGSGVVAVTDRLGHLVVLDAAAGRLRWRADADGAVERSGPVLVGDGVVLPLEDGRLMVASRRGRVFRDPVGRVSGVAAVGTRYVFATREALTNGLIAVDFRPSRSRR
jgi:outer membrane protein assembly factor BamB